MALDKSYGAINARKNDIIKNAMRIDYDEFEYEGIGFDYEGMMEMVGYSMDEMTEMLLSHRVGNTCTPTACTSTAPSAAADT